MTEPSPTEIHFSKAQPPSQEVQKRKKTSKKKPDPKPSNPRLEPLEGVIPDLNTEADFDLIHYTYKLEQQLSRVKKQLRLQKKNFRDVIHGLAKYFDDNGVSSQVVEEYIESLGTQIVDQQDRECEYEKFFTVHKYHIVEDPNTFNTKFVPKSGQKAENGPKNVPKSMNSSVKLDSGEQNPNDVSLEKIEKAEKAEKAEKSEKKKGRPPSKPSNPSANGTEEAPKKRKYTKHKQSEEGGGNMIPDIQEIPPFSPVKEVQKRSENKVKRAEDMIRGYEEMGQKPMDMSMLGPAAYGLDDGLKALMKQMNMDPSALMNPYIAGNFGLQEGDIYNKMLQELMKTSAPTAMLNTDKARQDLFNYYQGAFK